MQSTLFSSLPRFPHHLSREQLWVRKEVIVWCIIYPIYLPSVRIHVRMNRNTQTYLLPHDIGPSVGQSSLCLSLLFSVSARFLYEKELICTGTVTSLQADFGYSDPCGWTPQYGFQFDTKIRGDHLIWTIWSLLMVDKLYQKYISRLFLVYPDNL